MAKQKYQDKPKIIDQIKNNIDYYKIIVKAAIEKLFIFSKVVTQNVLIPALVILLSLTLIGYAINIMNYIASICLYFIIEEIKHFIKETKK